MSSKVTYRIAVGLLVAMQVFNAVGELLPLPEVLDSFRKTQLPVALLPFLVATKLLAAAALLLPGRFRVLQEWVYFGILLDVLGAAGSYLLAGAYGAFGLQMVVPALLVWGFAYWQYRRQVAPRHPLPDAHQRRGYQLLAWPFAVLMVLLGVGELVPVPPVAASMRLLAFPAHSLWLIGTAKLLGAAALLVPHRWPVLRHWAWAGFAYDFAGATYLYLAGGHLGFDLVLLLVLWAWLGLAYRQLLRGPHPGRVAARA